MPAASVPSDWAALPGEQLLDLRLCDLPIRIECGLLEARIGELRRELSGRGLDLPLHFYLSEEWFTPDGASAMAVPFYLAHPRLEKLEESQMLEVEGGDYEWCMRILRHEAGHLVDNMYALRRRRRRREIFGPSSEPYPDGIIITESSDNIIQGNFVGTLEGFVPASNGGNGIYAYTNSNRNLIVGTGAGESNLISGNEGSGMKIAFSGAATVQGNLIVTDFSAYGAMPNLVIGVFMWGASLNTIGGIEEGARNVISGNGLHGIEITGPNATWNVIEGNIVGLDIAGTNPLGNGANGIIVFDDAPVERQARQGVAWRREAARGLARHVEACQGRRSKPLDTREILRE